MLSLLLLYNITVVAVVIIIVAVTIITKQSNKCGSCSYYALCNIYAD